jgi:hypothetical protein
MANHHITFANHKYILSAYRLQKSAEAFGLRTRIYTRLSPPVLGLIIRAPLKMMARRGAGYWRWKPWIILDAFSRAREGDTVLYTDAGMEMIADPAPLLALAQTQPIVLFDHGQTADHKPINPMSHWTKRDCYVLMNADEERYYTPSQLLGGFQLYRVCAESRTFLEQLAKEYMDDRKITDRPNKCGLPNLPGYTKHRHDQAILSILAVKHGVRIYNDPSQFGVASPTSMGGPFFHLHRRKSIFYVKRALGSAVDKVLGQTN